MRPTLDSSILLPKTAHSSRPGRIQIRSQFIYGDKGWTAGRKGKNFTSLHKSSQIFNGHHKEYLLHALRNKHISNTQMTTEPSPLVSTDLGCSSSMLWLHRPDTHACIHTYVQAATHLQRVRNSQALTLVDVWLTADGLEAAAKQPKLTA